MLGPEAQAEAKKRRILLVHDRYSRGVWEPATAGSQQSKRVGGLHGFPLALLVGAVGLEDLGPALALAGILALTVVLGALAVALALAAVDAEATSLHGLGHGRADYGCARNEQNRSRHGHSSTRLLVELHFPLLCMSSRHPWRRATKRAIALNPGGFASLLIKAP